MTDYRVYQEEIVRLRRHFHRHPELALNEYETTAFIRKYLEKLGYEVKQPLEAGCSACLWLGEEYPTVLVRAEMDAVPVQEKTGLEFASEVPEVMHGCGHDANMAVLLVLAELCKSTCRELKCNVKFVFEPAEEIGQAGGGFGGKKQDFSKPLSFLYWHGKD